MIKKIFLLLILLQPLAGFTEVLTNAELVFKN